MSAIRYHTICLACPPDTQIRSRFTLLVTLMKEEKLKLSGLAAGERQQEIFYLKYIFNANFVTGIKRRDKAGPSQQYLSKEVGTRKAFLSTSMIPGIHAREWISPATVTYVMNELVTNPQHGGLLDMFDFFILPVANPDGLVTS